MVQCKRVGLTGVLAQCRCWKTRPPVALNVTDETTAHRAGAGHREDIRDTVIVKPHRDVQGISEGQW